MKNKVEFLFENCETVTLMISNFEYGLIKNLHSKYGNEPYHLSYILVPSLMTLFDTVDPFDGEYTTKFGDRLEWNDLVSIFIDGVEFKTYWDYDDDTQYNIMQHDFITKNGDLLITWG